MGRPDARGLPVRRQGPPPPDPRARPAAGRGRGRLPGPLPRVADAARARGWARCSCSSRRPAPATTRRWPTCSRCLPPGLPTALEFRHESWVARRGRGAHRRRRAGRSASRRPRASCCRGCRRGRSPTCACAPTATRRGARGLARPARARGGRPAGLRLRQARGHARPATPSAASGSPSGSSGRRGRRETRGRPASRLTTTRHASSHASLSRRGRRAGERPATRSSPPASASSPAPAAPRRER